MKAKQTPKKVPKTNKRTLSSGLTIKQERFCHEYIDTGNATESYRRTYSTERMKEATVNRNAKSLLDHNKISARIQYLRDQITEVSTIKKEKLLYVLESISSAKITDYVEFDGYNVRFKPFDKLTDQQIRAIESIKQNEKGEIELKLHGKSWSTDRICKMLGYDAPTKIDQRTEITIDMSVEQTLKLESLSEHERELVRQVALKQIASMSGVSNN
jgi:phage terminase small subunit